MRGWGLPWLVLGLAGAGVGPDVEPLRIQADASFTRTLGSGEAHRYLLSLESGDYARLEIVQQEVDVAALLLGPSGAELDRVDSTGGLSTESFSLVAGETGDHILEVRPVYPDGTGEYRLSLVSLHDAGPEDRLRVEAERTDRKVGRCLTRGGAESVELARSAVEKWRALGDRLHEAGALSRLGMIQLSFGDPREALAAGGQALALRRALGDREGMADTLNLLGRTHRLLGDGRSALRAFDESIALWQELGRPDRAVRVLLNAGNVHESFGDTAAALDTYERALALGIEAKDRRLEATALNSLGQLHVSLGEPTRAQEELGRALDLARATGRRNTEGQVLANLGVLYRNLGMPREALEHFSAAREIFRQSGDAENEAATLNNLGILLLQLGAPEDARELLLKALPLRRDPRDKAMTLVGLSWVSEELGRIEEAVAHAEQALELQRGMRDRAGEAETLRIQALLVLQLRDAAGAERKLRESLRIFEELGRRSGIAAALRGLARIHAAQGKLDAAREAYEDSRRRSEALGDVGAQILTLAEQAGLEHQDGKLDAARQRLEAALALMESFRSEVGGEQLRALHFATVRETYERYVDVLMRLHLKKPDAGLAEKAFSVAEQSRSRGLLDVLARAGIDTREGDPELLRRELRLRQELNAKAARLMSVPDDEASRARSESLRQEIETLAAEHRIAEGRLAHGSYGSLKSPAVPVREIQELLDGETVLLEYLLAEPNSYLWVVTPTSLKAFQLPGRGEIETLTRRLHERLRELGERDVSGQRKDLELLSTQVLGPALGEIAGRRRLVIVADGALHYVPFAALPVAASGAGPRTPHLVTEHEIVLAPSAAVLRELRRARAGRPPLPASLAIVADPVYSEPGRAEQPKLLAPRSSRLDALPWSRREAEGIAAVAQGRDVLMALGAEATLDLVTSGRLNRFRALHFATHGFLDSELPQLSGLALSQLDKEGRPVDGFLRLQDLYSLRLQADLVVLSGCETGLGRELRGEGLVGMTHGFFHAGASQVVASLWPVRDRAAAELMQRFYRSMLRDGLHPAAALRAAQLEMLSHYSWKDPYFWAPFVAQGDWTTGLQPVG